MRQLPKYRRNYSYIRFHKISLTRSSYLEIFKKKFDIIQFGFRNIQLNSIFFGLINRLQFYTRKLSSTLLID